MQPLVESSLDYYETAHYVFVHGWIPCIQERDGSYSHRSDWREATPEEWRRARWINRAEAPASSATSGADADASR